MRTLLAVALVLVAAAPAQAAWFGAEPVDGPAPIDALGGVSLGAQGAGGVVYVKGGAGYLSRFAGGTWRPPERLPGAGVTDAKIVAWGDALAVMWIAGGTVYAAQGRAGAPLTAPVALSGGGASGLDIATGAEGGAYAVWSAAGDVRAAKTAGLGWALAGAPLDIVRSRAAGTGAGRPRVDVAADDTAVVTWGETDTGGVSHVYYRRVFGTALSAYPQEASVPGGTADSPQIAVQYDSSLAWVVFREVVGGASRTLARRLRGATFDPPVFVDGGLPSTSPALAMDGVGRGFAVSAGPSGTVLGAALDDDAFAPATRLDPTAGAADPRVAVSDRGDAAVAYRTDAVVRGRSLPAGLETVLSRPAAGAVVPDSLAVAGDSVGDTLVAMLQGPTGARTLTVAVQDLPPARPVASARTRYVNPRAGLRWRAGVDYLGAPSFQVLVDGRRIATTAATTLRTGRIREGRHRLQIVQLDRRGQATAGRGTPMVVDMRKPKVRVRASHSGRLVTLTVRASDPGRHATGVRRIRVDWGDGHRSSSLGGRFRHRYSGKRRSRLTVSVRDRARNTTVRHP